MLSNLTLVPGRLAAECRALGDTRHRGIDTAIDSLIGSRIHWPLRTHKWPDYGGI